MHGPFTPEQIRQAEALWERLFSLYIRTGDLRIARLRHRAFLRVLGMQMYVQTQGKKVRDYNNWKRRMGRCAARSR